MERVLDVGVVAGTPVAVVTEVKKRRGAKPKEKVIRADYVIPEGGVSWPIEGLSYEDFRKQYKRIKKKHFKDTKSHLLYIADGFKFEAGRIGKKMNAMLAKADRFVARATNLAKFKDEETAKKASKILRMQEQLAKMKEQFHLEGIDIEALKND